MDLTKKELSQKASIMYYEKNMSQNEIAKELNISRSYVSQLLSFAKETGIVKIIINVDEYNLRDVRREIEFKSKFPKLKQVYIMSSESEEFTQRNLGKFASPYITEMINECKVIGVNLGASVEKTINCLEPQSFTNTSSKKVVQIMGGFNNNNLIEGAHPNELVKGLATILGCECYYLNCPAIVELPEVRKALLKEKSIKSVVAIWDNIDLAIMGIGVADERSKLFKLFTDSMIQKIEKSNVVGELTINFFHEDGEYQPLLEDNKISIEYEQLKKVNKKVVICYGEYKSSAILSALRANMIDILITDSITVNAIEQSIAKGLKYPNYC